MNEEALELKAYALKYDFVNSARDAVSELYGIIIIILAMLAFAIVPVFASSSGIFSDMVNQLTTGYNDFLPVINICALIFGSIAGLMFMFSSNEQDAAKTKKWLIRIVVGWLIISVLPYVLISLRKLLGSSATGTGSDKLKTIKPGVS